MTRLRSFATFVATLAVSTPALAQSNATFRGYTTTIPSGWKSAPSSSSMRLAQYTIADADGSTAAEVVVYFFGEGQGGGVEANLERWKAQFSTPDGSPVYENVAKLTGAAFPITVAEYRGTYARGVGVGDAATAKPGQSLVAVIAETPKGTLFFQMFGATAKVSAHRAALEAFVKGMKD